MTPPVGQNAPKDHGNPGDLAPVHAEKADLEPELDHAMADVTRLTTMNGRNKSESVTKVIVNHARLQNLLATVLNRNAIGLKTANVLKSQNACGLHGAISVLVRRRVGTVR